MVIIDTLQKEGKPLKVIAYKDGKELSWNILKESWLRGKSVVEQAG